MSYFELCRIVSPFEEGTCDLPIFLLCVPIVLLASNVWHVNYLLRVLISTFTRRFPSQQNPKSPQWAYPSQMVYPRNAPFQQLYPHGVWVIFLKKTRQRNKERKKNKKETRPIPPLKRVEIRSSNKRTKCFLRMSPFPPSPLNILPSIRLGFDWVPTSCKPLFGSATQVTKLCYTFSYLKLHISALD